MTLYKMTLAYLANLHGLSLAMPPSVATAKKNFLCRTPFALWTINFKTFIMSLYSVPNTLLSSFCLMIFLLQIKILKLLLIFSNRTQQLFLLKISLWNQTFHHDKVQFLEPLFEGHIHCSDSWECVPHIYIRFHFVQLLHSSCLFLQQKHVPFPVLVVWAMSIYHISNQKKKKQHSIFEYIEEIVNAG